MASQPDLMAAYQALFSSTPQGAMMRRRVRLGLSTGGQNRVTGGAPVPNAGTSTSNPYVDFPDARGGSPMSGGVPGGGTPGGGVPGGTGPASVGRGWTFSGPTANAWGGYGKTVGGIVAGPMGMAAGWGLGRLAGSIRDNQFYGSFIPGYGMPRFMSGPTVDPGVDLSGRTPNTIGGPDERGGGFGGGGLGGGGSSGGGLGGGSGAEGPDPSGWA